MNLIERSWSKKFQSCQAVLIAHALILSWNKFDAAEFTDKSKNQPKTETGNLESKHSNAIAFIQTNKTKGQNL